MVILKSDMVTALLRIRLFLALVGIVLLGSGLRSSAQTTAQDVNGDLVREIHPKPTPTPFPLDAHTGTVPKLDFLAPEQMAAADVELVDANAAEIARRASLQGFNLERGGGWGYEQAVCPVFPDHLILEYSRDSGAGDVSLFSVAIPRGMAKRGPCAGDPGSAAQLFIVDYGTLECADRERLQSHGERGRQGRRSGLAYAEPVLHGAGRRACARSAGSCYARRGVLSAVRAS